MMFYTMGNVVSIIIEIIFNVIWPIGIVLLMVVAFRKKATWALIFLGLAALCLLYIIGYFVFLNIRTPHVKVPIDLGAQNYVSRSKYNHRIADEFTVFLSLPRVPRLPFDAYEAVKFQGQIKVLVRGSNGMSVLKVIGEKGTLNADGWASDEVRYKIGEYAAKAGNYEIEVSILVPDTRFKAEKAYIGIRPPYDTSGIDILPAFLGAFVCTLLGAARIMASSKSE